MESKDQEEEKRIKKNRDLQALMQLRQRNAPDVSDEVSRERGEDIQIHDGFGAMESKDQEEEKRIKKNRDLQALVQLRQRNAPDVSDEVPASVARTSRSTTVSARWSRRTRRRRSAPRRTVIFRR